MFHRSFNLQCLLLLFKSIRNTMKTCSQSKFYINVLPEIKLSQEETDPVSAITSAPYSSVHPWFESYGEDIGV